MRLRRSSRPKFLMPFEPTDCLSSELPVADLGDRFHCECCNLNIGRLEGNDTLLSLFVKRLHQSNSEIFSSVQVGEEPLERDAFVRRNQNLWFCLCRQGWRVLECVSHGRSGNPERCGR